MTATERARRSDALYYSNGPKRELCDKVALLESDLEDAKAENAKLREWCSELLRMAESHDPEWFHWPEMHEELRKMGVEVGE